MTSPRRNPLDVALLGLLVLDAVVLAVLELFFLPLRIRDLHLDALGLPNWPLPLSVLLAVVSTPWLVLAAARIAPRLSVAGLPLFVWAAALMLIGVVGPGGDMVLLNDWRSLLLLGGGALPAATVLGGVLGRPR